MAIYNPEDIENIVKYRVQQEMEKFMDKLRECMKSDSLNEITNKIFGIIREYEEKEKKT
jgi:hypothetical protein